MHKRYAGHAMGVCLQPSSIHGTGLYATRSFCVSQRIIEYAGKIRRWSDCADDDNTYTCLMDLGRNLVIDPQIDGNEARFINHSCSPNCHAVMDGKKVFIEAIGYIRRGAEITIDYAIILPRSLRNAQEMTIYACKCGSAYCRGTMLAPRKRRPAIVSTRTRGP